MSALPRPTRVNLFVTCLVDHLAPEVAEAVVTVLERLGLEVVVPEGQTCCGQPAFNGGFWDDAREIARYTLALLDATEGPIVVPSGSCTDMLVHHAATLFPDEPVWQARAARVAPRLYEFSQFLVDVLGQTEVGAEASIRLTYHSSCHLQRNLGIRRQPEALLNAVAGAEFVPLAQADECCGFGGLFSIKYPGISEDMLANKLRTVAETRADCLVGCDISCLMHINGGLRRQGKAATGIHLAQLLAGTDAPPAKGGTP